ncbi:MAG TPA: hypothetical protein VGS41_04835, partial [Chthonomonadales bacterium]|nr:hypothetical protein [Chthonomonadales bacterium]
MRHSTGKLALKWTATAPGIWMAAAGSPDVATLLSAAGPSLTAPALYPLPEATAPPFDLDLASASSVEEKTAVCLPLAPEERIFGLGLQMTGCNRRGSVIHLKMDHYSSGQDRLHAPVPLYLSSAGYAVLFNTI